MAYYRIENSILTANIMKYNGNRVLLFLIQHIVRAEMKYDPCNIYRDYYINQNLLATAWKQIIIAEKLGVTRQNVSVEIKRLEEKNIIKCIKTGKNKEKIFILGTVTKTGYEDLFLHKIAREELNSEVIKEKTVENINKILKVIEDDFYYA